MNILYTPSNFQSNPLKTPVNMEVLAPYGGRPPYQINTDKVNLTRIHKEPSPARLFVDADL